MALILPEIKHEYLFHLDTEETKNSVFDQCRAEGKEAAYSTFGTAQNDSEYQPAPTEEPDYYMQYCSSDGYDYLKDYRLVWGYGIGIIEQDVICSLTTGEHLAEGKEACDAYEAENAAGENVDWKRGIWLKFSGNRNNSPARIGEVILPEYIISLKDLCAVLTPTNGCVFEMFNSVRGVDVVTHILNISNLCGQKNITVTPNDNYYQADFFPLDVSYAFANATITGFDDPLGFWYIFQNAVNGNHCFYNAKLTVAMGDLNYFGKIENGNYESAFEGCTITATTGEEINYTGVVNKATFKNCKSTLLMPTMAKCIGDCESAFEGCTIDGTGSRDGDTDDNIDWNSLDFSRVTNAKRMFYNTSWVEDEVFLDLSSVIEHENGAFDNFLYVGSGGSKIFNIKASNFKIRGNSVFYLPVIGNTINVIGELKYYDYLDDINLAHTKNYTFNFICFMTLTNATVKGIFNGVNLFYHNYNNKPLFNEGSNIKLITKEYNQDEIYNIVNRHTYSNSYEDYITSYFPTPIINIREYSFYNYINIDDYFFIDCIATYNYGYRTQNVGYSIEVVKSNKSFAITGYFGNRANCDININNSTIYFANVGTHFKNDTYRDYYYKNTINFITENNYDITCLRCNNYNMGYTPTIYNLDKGTIIFANDENNIKGDVQLNIDKLYCINYNNFEDDGQATYNRIRINNLNNIIKDNGLVDWDKKLENAASGTTKYSIYVNNITNYITNNNEYYPTVTILAKDNMPNYPNVINSNNDKLNLSYNGFVGEFINTPLSDFIKRVDYINENESRLYLAAFYFNNVNNHERIIDDIIDESIQLSVVKTFVFGLNNINHSFNFTLYDNYYIKIGGFEDDELNIGSINIIGLDTIYTNLNDGYLQLRYMSNININSNVKLRPIQIINCTNCEHCNLNIKDTYSLTIDENSINITDFTLKSNIINNCNLTYLDKLTQESINSIVNPTNFASGCTLTINTIPFQYITEEQKQALVNAGVTLVEYIPQTE